MLAALSVLLLCLVAAAAAERPADVPAAPGVEVPAGDTSCPGAVGQAGCRRQRAMQGYSSPSREKDANDIGEEGAEDDPAFDKRVLHDARMTEDLRRGDDEDEGEEDDARIHDHHDDGDHDVQEGRSKRGSRQKMKKIDATMLQGLLALKMMPLMFISSKVAVLSFMVQLKSLLLALVSTAMAAVQFFWQFQEKRQRNNHQSATQHHLHLQHLAAAATPAAATNGWEDQSMWPDRRKYISF
ncbi:uncharacterized protein LOC113211943 [Frankliniella occidentalis]|uniref:Uncharacterized protein LOC113211943 n=1 Tax=Frankliniella occidentalis TaxID=133901 RepID=A0A6J1SZN6_FRAOC|nr:uncharacterized protein LOC113211943 [Frankliniella occidentalis]